MRWSQTYIPTLREKQSDAELISHQLLLRGGYIRKLASGIYIYLPLMQRVIDKFSQIVREEMNKAGAIEITMSVLCPSELWKKTGRYDAIGKDLMKMLDRHENEMVLCGTHEETVATIIRGDIKSYKQLPMNLYQIQVKFRDEIRPRFGLMRGREFIMKDAYTLDATLESQKISYQKMVDAYFNSFKRAGLDVLKVESDSGAMGGSNAHEFMLLVNTSGGEATIVACSNCDYAANEEKAVFKDNLSLNSKVDKKKMEIVDTPGASSIEEVTEFLKVDATNLAKTLIYMADGKAVAAMIRGDRELNEIKLKNHLNAVEMEMASPEEILSHTGAPVGFAGPVGLRDISIIVDPLVANQTNFVVGANQDGKHIINVNIDRDFKATAIVDITLACSNDLCAKCGGKLDSKRGIEVGNTFMLGTKYSEALGTKFLDAEGKEHPIIMGSYGIGITRTAQAALERYFDEDGIIWPKAIAPYLVEIIPLNLDITSVKEASEKVYSQLMDSGIDVLMDDRSERAGVKFNDADLIGMPIRITIGENSLKEGKIELKTRADNKVELVSIENIVEAVKNLSDLIN